MGLFKLQYVLAKIEGTYGDDPTPTEAANAILCSNVSFNLLNDFIDYQHVDQYLGMRSGSSQNFILGAEISFDVELKGSGSAVDTPPELGVLLRASNLTETINAGTSVVYTLNSLFFSDESSESITIYYQQGGILHEINGARGTFIMSGEAGRQVTLSFRFQGLYVAAVANAQSDITVNTTIPPRLVNASFTFDSYAACIQSFGLDIANNIVARECINATVNGISEYGITDRVPTFTMNPETPALGTYDFWGAFADTDEVAVAMTIGQTSTNRCTIAIPKAVISSSPNYADRNGITTQDISCMLKYSSGNDEVTFTFD